MAGFTNSTTSGNAGTVGSIVPSAAVGEMNVTAPSPTVIVNWRVVDRSGWPGFAEPPVEMALTLNVYDPCSNGKPITRAYPVRAP